MGKQKNETAREEIPGAVPEVKAAEEASYTADEFAQAAGAVFGPGITPDLVRAAFRVAGKDKSGIEEAKKLVNDFANKEVK